MGEQLKFMRKAYAKAQRKEYPVYEHFRVCMALAFIGGFLESYTYLLKGNIFANAQTGNFALMAMNFAYYKDPLKGLYYLIPISAYVAAIFLTIHMPRKFNGRISWHTLFVIIQFAAFLCIGFLPPEVPYGVTTVAVAFLCAMQYNTFKACRGVTMATVFCTNNLRQFAISLSKSFSEDRNAVIKNGILYLANIMFFVLGAGTSAWLIRFLSEAGIRSEYSIWLCCIILIPVGLYLHFAQHQKTQS